jgi:hypothetical protein
MFMGMDMYFIKKELGILGANTSDATPITQVDHNPVIDGRTVQTAAHDIDRLPVIFSIQDVTIEH